MNDLQSILSAIPKPVEDLEEDQLAGVAVSPKKSYGVSKWTPQSQIRERGGAGASKRDYSGIKYSRGSQVKDAAVGSGASYLGSMSRGIQTPPQEPSAAPSTAPASLPDVFDLASLMNDLQSILSAIPKPVEDLEEDQLAGVAVSPKKSYGVSKWTPQSQIRERGGAGASKRDYSGIKYSRGSQVKDATVGSGASYLGSMSRGIQTPPQEPSAAPSTAPASLPDVFDLASLMNDLQSILSAIPKPVEDLEEDQLAGVAASPKKLSSITKIDSEKTTPLLKPHNYYAPTKPDVRHQSARSSVQGGGYLETLWGMVNRLESFADAVHSTVMLHPSEPALNLPVLLSDLESMLISSAEAAKQTRIPSEALFDLSILMNDLEDLLSNADFSVPKALEPVLDLPVLLMDLETMLISAADAADQIRIPDKTLSSLSILVNDLEDLLSNSDFSVPKVPEPALDLPVLLSDLESMLISAAEAAKQTRIPSKSLSDLSILVNDLEDLLSNADFWEPKDVESVLDLPVLLSDLESMLISAAEAAKQTRIPGKSLSDLSILVNDLEDLLSSAPFSIPKARESVLDLPVLLSDLESMLISATEAAKQTRISSKSLSDLSILVNDLEDLLSNADFSVPKAPESVLDLPVLLSDLESMLIIAAEAAKETRIPDQALSNLSILVNDLEGLLSNADFSVAKASEQVLNLPVLLSDLETMLISATEAAERMKIPDQALSDLAVLVNDLEELLSAADFSALKPLEPTFNLSVLLADLETLIHRSDVSVKQENPEAADVLALSDG